MRRLAFSALLSAVLLSPVALRAEAVVVAVDPLFAPVAQALSQSFSDRTGHELRLAVMALGELPEAVDVVLAEDAALPSRLAQEGLADPATRVTYAMGATGTEAATAPRDAILMQGAADKPVAQEFMAFLMTPDAWDLIVSHGYGAY